MIPAAKCRSMVEQAGAVDGADGRWLVNNGDAMDMVVDGLNVVKGQSQPIRCVIDLEQLKPARATISALYNHEGLIGHWSDIEISPKGIVQTLRLTRPANEIEARVLAEAVMVGAHLRAKVPWQASIGARPRADGQWELIEAGESVVVNGRTFLADTPEPLYVLRGGELFETSVCEFGADGRTGQIAATKTDHKPTATTKESDMSRIKLAASLSKGKPAAMCAAILALCADESVPDSEIGPKVTAMEMDDLKCRLTAAEEGGKKKDEMIATLQAQVAAKAADEKPADDKKPEEDAKAKAAAAASDKGVAFAEGKTDVVEAPKTRLAAQAAIKAKNPKLVGFGVVTAARREFKNYDSLPIA